MCAPKDDRQVRTTGAGCVCIAVDDQGLGYVLLGREAHNPYWADGSHRWSSFSGRVEAGEDATRAAAREFAEESLCLVRLGSRAGDAAEAAAHIRSSSLGVVEHTVEGRRGPCRNVLYLLPVPLDPGLPARFARLRGELEALDVATRGFARFCRSLQHLPLLCVPGTVLSHRLVVSQVRLGVGPDCALVVWDAHERRAVQMSLLLSEDQRREAERVLERWAALVRRLEGCSEQTLRHPAVSLTHAAGRLLSARVGAEYLEKTEVAWWSLSDLQEVLAGAHRDSFRAYFLGMLPEILERVSDSGAV